MRWIDLTIEEEPLFNPTHSLPGPHAFFFVPGSAGHPTYIAMWLQKGNPEP